MSASFLNVDISLKLVSYLDLSSAVALSKTCSYLYQLSLSSISYWIYTTDIHRLPVSASQIRDNHPADQIRYMARVVTAYGANLRGDEFAVFDASRCKFRNDGLRRLTSDNPTSFWGASSAFVQGYTAQSLPWLLTVKGNILRCDCLDQNYDVGVEWDAEAIIDWFWRCDVTSSSTQGTLEEFILVTITANDSSGNIVDAFSNAGLRVRTTKLYIVKISLPLREDFDAVRGYSMREYIMPLFLSSTYYKSTTNANHDIPSPKICQTTCTALPPGFINDTCRPTSCGSKVYLMLKNKDSNPSTFSVFVYDWKQNSGARCQLPKDIGWRKVVGFSSMMIFQDWQGPVYGMPVPKLFPLPHNQPPDAPGSNSSTWHCDSKPLPLQLIHFQENVTGADWDPIDTIANTTLLPLTGTIFQISDDAFYLISRVGARLCCCVYRLKSKNDGEASEVEFSRVAGGFVDIGDSTGDRYISLKTGGLRSLVVAVRPPEGGSKRSLTFLIIDFDIDGDYDGSEGIKTVPGVKRELQIAGQIRSLLGKTKASEVFDKGNIGELFFDGFRGTIGVVGKDYKEAFLFKCTKN